MTKLCECGCGEPAPIATVTRTRRNSVKGQPLRYVWGHRMKSNKPPYVVDAATGCWVWQRGKVGAGYGCVAVKDCASDGSRYAHRVFYEKRYGPIPVGYEIDHLCSNPACVNPDHLEPVAHVVNVRRGRKTKLTIEAARAIKRSSQSDSELAQRYGVGESAIYHVRKGLNWKDVVV